MKLKALALMTLVSSVALAGCSMSANEFATLKQIENVEVTDVGSEAIGKVSYPTLSYQVGRKEKELTFYDSDSKGFVDYYESAQDFNEKVVVDIIVNDEDRIMALVLVNGGKEK